MNKEQKSEIEKEKERQKLLKKMGANADPKKPSDIKAFLESKGLKVRFQCQDTNQQK